MVLLLLSLFVLFLRLSSGQVADFEVDINSGPEGSALLGTIGVEMTTPIPKCHLALQDWVPIFMDYANQCIADDPDSVDRMKMRTSKTLLPHFNCIFKCAAMKLGVIKEDGTVDHFSVVDFVEENVYEYYKDLAYEVLAGCIEYSGNLVDPSDFNCYTYSKMFRCISNASRKVADFCAKRLGIWTDYSGLKFG